MKYNRCLGETLHKVAKFSVKYLLYVLIHFQTAKLHIFLLFRVFPCSCCFVHFYVCLCFAGIRSWDTNLIDCNLDQELKLFVSRHSARFSADVRGKQKMKDIFVNVMVAVWLRL